MNEALGSSESSALARATRRNIPHILLLLSRLQPLIWCGSGSESDGRRVDRAPLILCFGSLVLLMLPAHWEEDTHGFEPGDEGKRDDIGLLSPVASLFPVPEYSAVLFSLCPVIPCFLISQPSVILNPLVRYSFYLFRFSLHPDDLINLIPQYPYQVSKLQPDNGRLPKHLPNDLPARLSVLFVAIVFKVLFVSLIPTSHNTHQLQRSATEHSSTCKFHSHKPQQA
jgi:hypothetical protein